MGENIYTSLCQGSAQISTHKTVPSQAQLQSKLNWISPKIYPDVKSIINVLKIQN